jgi:hypothetical protein
VNAAAEWLYRRKVQKTQLLVRETDTGVVPFYERHPGFLADGVWLLGAAILIAFGTAFIAIIVRFLIDQWAAARDHAPIVLPGPELCRLWGAQNVNNGHVQPATHDAAMTKIGAT